MSRLPTPPVSPPTVDGPTRPDRHRRRVGTTLVILGIIAAAGTAVLVHQRGALWRIVHDQCVPRQQAAGDPDPCLDVDLIRGAAVLKDRVGVAQLLLIPTRRVTGIEDPSLADPATPNDWQAAWLARRFMPRFLGRTPPREAVSLAVNGPWGRTQDQLHIHVDCVRPEVAAALARHQDSLTAEWKDFPVPLVGQTYQARRVDGVDLSGVNPYHLLADRGTDESRSLGNRALVAVGMTFRDGTPGFALLTTDTNLGTVNLAVGERLQDHDCTALSRHAP